MKKYTTPHKIIGNKRLFFVRRNSFTKNFTKYSQYKKELNGNMVAKENSLSTLFIISAQNLKIKYERVTTPNAKQLFFTKKLTVSEILDIVSDLAFFHSATYVKTPPKLTTIKFRLKKFLEEMFDFKDFDLKNKKKLTEIYNSTVKNIFKSRNSCYIHGDFFLENIFVINGKNTYFDWEFSEVSTPSYDLVIFLNTIFFYCVKFQILSFKDYVNIELLVFKKYFSFNKKSPESIFIREFKQLRMFDDHCMYFFYLTILKNFYSEELQKCFTDQEDKFEFNFLNLLKKLNIDGYFPKQSSLVKLIKWIAQYPEGLNKIYILSID